MGKASMSRRQRAVFLDRDGVLNRALVRNAQPFPPASPSDLEIVPDITALGELKALGFLLLVVTNQPDVARGTQTGEIVDAINDRLKAIVPLDDIFVCYHTDGDQCDCRKPEPGLILRAAEKYGIDLVDSYLIGDCWRDIEAGERAGCKSVLIAPGYLEPGPRLGPDIRVPSLRSAADWIVEQNSRDSAV
jgi:D-glycero-D-manno-heptose 1,7-bisphosphate phosphatase